MVKSTNFLIGILFAFVFVIGFASAVEIQQADQTFSLTPSSNQSTFTISSVNATEFNLTGSFPRTITTQGVDVVLSLIGSQNNVNSTQLRATVNSNQLSGKSFDFSDSVSFNVEAVNSSNLSQSDSINVNINIRNDNFCGVVSNPAELEVSVDRIRVVEGFGRNDDFYPLDVIEVRFDVFNRGDWDVRSIEIEIEVYDLDENRVRFTEDDMDLSISRFNLNSNRNERGIRAVFELDPRDLGLDSNNYEILIRATGEIRDSDAGSLDRSNSCAYDSDRMDVILDEFVIVNNIQFPSDLVCGDTFELTANAWNIGDIELYEDEVFIRIINTALGINEVVEFDNGIWGLDRETFSRTITIPEDTERGTYPLQFVVYNDERMSNNDIFRLDRRDAIYTADLFVDCLAALQEPSITASLKSGTETRVGEDLMVELVITNPSENDGTSFIVVLERYSSWASSAVLDSSSFNLDSGESRTIEAVFKPTSAGEQEFTVSVIYGGRVVEQTVSVSIDEATGFGARLRNAFDIEFSPVFWLTIAIFIVLILIILVLLIKFINSQKQ